MTPHLYSERLFKRICGFVSVLERLSFKFTLHFVLFCVCLAVSEQSKAMLTELCLASDEFDHFSAKVHNSVTFCLKELRVRERKQGEVTEQSSRCISLPVEPGREIM